jgi:hypothetical protein
MVRRRRTGTRLRCPSTLEVVPAGIRRRGRGRAPVPASPYERDPVAGARRTQGHRRLAPGDAVSDDDCARSPIDGMLPAIALGEGLAGARRAAPVEARIDNGAGRGDRRPTVRQWSTTLSAPSATVRRVVERAAEGNTTEALRSPLGGSIDEEKRFLSIDDCANRHCPEPQKSPAPIPLLNRRAPLT